MDFFSGWYNLWSDMMRSPSTGLLVRTSDPSDFKVGKDIGCTPGDVVYQTDLLQVLRYSSLGIHPTIRSVPLLMVPSWINKYYILDLSPKNSMVKYLVDQGFDVYMISWKSFNFIWDRDFTVQDYVDNINSVVDFISNHTGFRVNVAGYCLGGTLLSLIDHSKVNTVTLLTSMLDFHNSGDIYKSVLSSLTYDYVVSFVNRNGYMDGRILQQGFNWMKYDTMVSPYIVDRYMLGKDNKKIDILYWNDDNTNISKSSYLHILNSWYRDNSIYKDDSIYINKPTYVLGTKDDHICPIQNILSSHDKLLVSKSRSVVTDSGHVSGVINPPCKNKYGYTVDGQWYKGSWWPDWVKWLSGYSGPYLKPKYLKSYGKSPGTYVMDRI